MYNDELMHYGVLGMKWGVRKDRSKTISKAYKKLERLDSDIERRTKQADIAVSRVNRGVTSRYKRLKQRADRLQYAADKKAVDYSETKDEPKCFKKERTGQDTKQIDIKMSQNDI